VLRSAVRYPRGRQYSARCTSTYRRQAIQWPWTVPYQPQNFCFRPPPLFTLAYLYSDKPLVHLHARNPPLAAPLSSCSRARETGYLVSAPFAQVAIPHALAHTHTAVSTTQSHSWDLAVFKFSSFTSPDPPMGGTRDVRSIHPDYVNFAPVESTSSIVPAPLSSN